MHGQNSEKTRDVELNAADELLILALQDTAQRWRQSGPAIDFERVDKAEAQSVWRWLEIADQEALSDLMREQDAVAIRPPVVALFPANLVVVRPAIGAPALAEVKFEIIKFSKSNGPLTKRISLSDDGVKSDGSACTMARGTAERIRLTDIHQLAELIGGLQSDEAITLGVLRPGVPDQVKVVTKTKLKAYGGARHAVIARTTDDIGYRKGRPALALLDFDTKGMPPDVAAEMERLGGFWPALLSVLPTLQDTARVTRASTSAGLYNADTGERLPGSSGRHDYIVVHDGADIERFLKTLHKRCLLAGLGWMMVGTGGQLLERSIVDRMVGSPERLVFEGAPILDPPLEQDRESRRPVAVDGEALDTIATCPPLTVSETAKFIVLQARESHRLAPEVARERAAFIETQAAHLSKHAGMPKHVAEKIITHQCEGILLPNLVLPFDDQELAGITVADVLADPNRFEGETLADPLEGVDYGRCCARIMRRPDGTPWIHSFAHGRTIYNLKYDAAAVRKAIEGAEKDAMTEVFVRLVLAAELDADELEELGNLVAKRSGVGKRAINEKLKAAREKKNKQQAEQERNRRSARHRDPRPHIKVPFIDAPWLPVMGILNEILGQVDTARPPARDIDSFATKARKLRVPNMHAFGSHDTNAEHEEKLTTKLPAPEQWILQRMNEMQAAEMIEEHSDFIEVDQDDNIVRSVHLPTPFVRHFMQREDSLPSMVAIATLPIVLADGGLLMKDSLDRKRGIFFVIPKELRALIPDRKNCTQEAVKAAMAFLCDEWLCDVAADYTGKCILIAAALTIIERSLLPDRPAFFVTAGRRGGGKTTTLTMLIMAVLGMHPAAAAWSTNEEERRKALLSYFLSGVAYIIWDNITKGSRISCPHIEKSCTAAYYSDRKLGVSEMVATAASTIHFFTGNNIGPRGDLASRSLEIRLDVDRSDPENRDFKHPDPLGWTENNRGEILRALYMILLGNPMLEKPRDAPTKTRFKMWWRLVGSAIEHGAELAEKRVDFRALFLAQDDDDEESASLADGLDTMATVWGRDKLFEANQVADLINKPEDPFGRILREWLYPGVESGFLATAKSVGKRLKSHLDGPVKSGEETLTLRSKWNSKMKQRSYCVHAGEGH